LTVKTKSFDGVKMRIFPSLRALCERCRVDVGGWGSTACKPKQLEQSQLLGGCRGVGLNCM